MIDKNYLLELYHNKILINNFYLLEFYFLKEYLEIKSVILPTLLKIRLKTLHIAIKSDIFGKKHKIYQKSMPQIKPSPQKPQNIHKVRLG